MVPYASLNKEGLGMTIRSALEEFAVKHSDHVAQVFWRGQGWVRRTYGEFLADVKATAEAYGSKFGLKPREENVAQILPNSPEWMDVYLACSGAGVSVVPLDPKLHNEEVEYILRDAEVRVFGKYAVYAILDERRRAALFRTVGEILLEK